MLRGRLGFLAGWPCDLLQRLNLGNEDLSGRSGAANGNGPFFKTGPQPGDRVPLFGRGWRRVGPGARDEVGGWRVERVNVGYSLEQLLELGKHLDEPPDHADGETNSAGLAAESIRTMPYWRILRSRSLRPMRQAFSTWVRKRGGSGGGATAGQGARLAPGGGGSGRARRRRPWRSRRRWAARRGRRGSRRAVLWRRASRRGGRDRRRRNRCRCAAGRGRDRRHRNARHPPARRR